MLFFSESIVHEIDKWIKVKGDISIFYMRAWIVQSEKVDTYISMYTALYIPELGRWGYRLQLGMDFRVRPRPQSWQTQSVYVV